MIPSTFVAVDQHTTFLDDYFSFLAIGPLIPVSLWKRTPNFRYMRARFLGIGVSIGLSLRHLALLIEPLLGGDPATVLALPLSRRQARSIRR